MTKAEKDALAAADKAEKAAAATAKAEKDALAAADKAEGVPTLIVTGFLKCDGIRYQPGESFPLDHPESERLFDLGAIKEG